MEFLSWLSGIFSSEIVIVFSIAVLGYLLGRFQIKGLCLGTSGILLIALIFGHFDLLVPDVLKNIGLICFVTAVGFIAGPNFFRNFKKSAIFYVILGLIIVFAGGVVCVSAIKIGGIDTDLAVGMLSGALTSTPGLAAAKEATGAGSRAAIGYGIAYPFGVVGVVLFVQLVPKLMKVNMDQERARLENQSVNTINVQSTLVEKKRFVLDEFGLLAFSFAAILGVVIGKISIPLPGGAHFSLGTSGGPLLSGLVMGHFAHIGPVSINVPKKTLDVVREVGLALFLMGAGTEAGQGFLAVLTEQGVSLFIWGAVMTILPMAIGFILAVCVAKLDVFNALGSICGGMTSTPALGTLMAVAKTESVATAYAATYPLALIAVVLCCEFIPLFF